MLVGIVSLAVLLGASSCTRTETPTEQGEVKIASAAAHFLFADDFEDNALQGWDPVSGSWRAGGGILTLSDWGPGRGTKHEPKIIALSDLPPRNCRIEVDVRFLAKPREEAFAGIVFRYQDNFNYYWFRFCDFEKYQDRYEVWEMLKGQRIINQGGQKITFNPGQWFRLAVEVEDSNLRAYLDGEQVINLTHPDLESGTVGLATKKTKAVEFRRFRVLAL